MIRVLFFARLREQLDCSELLVDATDSVQLLRQKILSEHPHWQEFFNKQILIAVNQTLVKDNHPLRDGDEVAFFPPVTGG